MVTVTGSGQRATLLPPSVHVKLTRTSVLFHPAAFGGGLTTALIPGRLLSMLSVTDAAAWLPATSTAVPVTTWPAPSVLTVMGSGHRAMPLPPSVHVKLTLTSLLFQPAAFADGLTTALIVGRLLSMLSVTDTVAWLPALSTAVPLTTCPALSVLTVTGSGHRAIPLTASLHVKLTRTSVLFQPAAFGSGLTTVLTLGRLLSMLSVTDALAWFPATSTAVPLTTCPAPSVLTVTGSGHRAIPLRASVHVKLTCTSALLQPAALGAGLTDALMTGGVSSTPTMRRLIPQPGLARNSTVKRFDLESDTDRSTVAMFWLRSDVPTTFTPFTSTMALDTRQNWPAGKPPLSTRRV